MTPSKRTVYRVMNTIIPRGDGYCAHCRPGMACPICLLKIRGHGKCSRCDGKGTDIHGLHCAECRSNFEQWGGGENAFKIHKLYETLTTALDQR